MVACIVRNASLLAPMMQAGLDYDLNALFSLVRDWASEQLLTAHSLATFLVVENINDLHPLIVNNPRVARCKIPLPTPSQLQATLAILAPLYPTALQDYKQDMDSISAQLAGKERITSADPVKLKKQMVEDECNGLIESILHSHAQRYLRSGEGEDMVAPGHHTLAR
jgi:hypothetical protein